MTRRVLGLLLSVLVVVASGSSLVLAQQAPAAQPAANAKTTPPSGPATPAPAPAAQDANGNPAAEATPAPQSPAPPPQPKAQVPEELQRPLLSLQATMDDIATQLDREGARDRDLLELRTRIDAASAEGKALADSVRPKIAEVDTQIEKLGKVPEAGQAPEAQEVVAERARLGAVRSGLDGVIKSADLVQVRATQLTQRVQELRQARFTQRLFSRRQSPLMPSLWRDVISELPNAFEQVKVISTRWWVSARYDLPGLSALLGAVLAIYALLKAAVVYAVRKAHGNVGPRPSFFLRAAGAGWVAAALALPSAAAALLLAFGLDSLKLLTYQVDKLSETALPAFLIFVAVSALARSVLAPQRPRWRLIDLSDKAARKVATTISWMAGVYAVDLVLRALVYILSLPLTISMAIAALSSIAIALLLVRLARTNLTPAPWPIEAEGASPTSTGPAAVPVTVPTEAMSDAAASSGVENRLSWLRPYLLKVPILLAALAILAATFSGYIALGRFMAGQVVVTGSVIALVLLLHLAIRALIGEPGHEGDRLKTPFDAKLGLGDEQRNLLGRGIAILLNVALALLALPLILLTWGFTQGDAIDLVRRAVFGFEIGNFRVSLAQIVIAIGLFLALMIVTRLVQRWLSSRLSRPPRVVEQGIADSIQTFVGYVGIALAVLAALSYSGLDITNFAIVAGALSVGIGLGLQSIVNNFVSGLIILIERPIKVGDLVNVKGQEGHVRRISVRSTEIETADRASLIVPNSDIITSTVTNWTHRNPLGRVLVKVGVSYSSDPDRVRSILQTVAKECPLIMQIPSPFVGFDNFGANALEFSLSGVVPDISRSGTAQTDLRLRILKAFRENGIEIAYAQHDVHLRDLDGVKTVLTAMMQERARQANEASQAPNEATRGGGAVPFPRQPG